MGSESRRAILAVVLSGIILFGWQYFFGQEQFAQQQAKVEKVEVKKVAENNVVTDVKENLEEVVSETFELKNGSFSYTLTNQLEVVKTVSDNTDKGLEEVYGKAFNKPYFKFSNEYKPLSFIVKKLNDSSVKIVNSVNDFSGTIELNSEGFLKVNLNSSKNFRVKFNLASTEETNENQKVKEYVYLADDLNLLTVGDEDKVDSKISWFGFNYNYHIFLFMFDEAENSLINTDDEGQFSLRPSKESNTLSYKTFFAKKNFDYLKSKGSKLELSIDYGIWSLIAVPILRGLQFFYTLFPNYGISIILLTFIIRMLMFPLQYKSFKSMKKMQEVQPELTAIKERFKDNPQKIQQETMALFKRVGANPLGGCLPMLAQMPVFFAFYKVLFTSVELVDAPFYFWITDLSTKDPYYVLPALMALAMFFNQKITPMTTTDPVQKKVMTFMPLLFAVFMKDLPSGLSLYILISTIVGMAQQLLVFKRN